MANNHKHRYRRINIGHNKIYWVMKCTKPGCTHYTPMKSKLSCPALVGQVAECNKCHKPFELTTLLLRAARPICFNCIERKSETTEQLNEADALVKMLTEEEPNA